MQTYHTKMGDGGRVVIPQMFREEMGIESGQEVLMTLDEAGLHISTPMQGWYKLQELVAEHFPGNRRLSDELIAERRKAARDEI